MTLQQRKKRVAEISLELERIVNTVSAVGGRFAGTRKRQRNARIKQLIEARYQHQQIIDREEENALAGN